MHFPTSFIAAITPFFLLSTTSSAFQSQAERDHGVKGTCLPFPIASKHQLIKIVDTVEKLGPRPRSPLHGLLYLLLQPSGAMGRTRPTRRVMMKLATLMLLMMMTRTVGVLVMSRMGLAVVG
jgi:hypothetical protein